MKRLDVLQILAERDERRKRELELNGLPSESNDSLPATPNFSDSILIESSSQSALSQSSTLEELNCVTVLDVFDDTQVYRFYSEDEVNFSWLEKDLCIDDVPKMCSADLINYLKSEIKISYLKRTQKTCKLTCRYLFFLMSVTKSKAVAEVCLKLLAEKMSDTNQPFSIEVPDLLLVLMNYGAVQSKLWPEALEISFPRAFRNFPINSFDSKEHSLPFPRFNLEKILSLLSFNLKTYPYFSENEKIGMCNVMLNLYMANFIAGDTFLTLKIRDVVSLILESFTEQEWSEFDFKMVEELVLQCGIDKLEPTAMVHRITYSIPTTTSRGVMFQQSAAYFAIQHLMNLEEIDLCGRVSVKDVHRLVVLLSQQKLKNYRTLFSIVTLLRLTLDVNDPSIKKKELKNLYVKLSEVRHGINDLSDKLDTAPMLVKDLMCEISLFWKNAIPINNVVSRFIVFTTPWLLGLFKTMCSQLSLLLTSTKSILSGCPEDSENVKCLPLFSDCVARILI